MKILHLSTAKTWRGGEQQISYLFEELHKLDVKQQIMCAEGSAIAKHCVKNDWPHITAPKKGSISMPYAAKLAKVSGVVDLVHIHDSHAHNNAIFSTFLGNKKPMVLHRRVDFPVSKNPFSRYKYNHPNIKRIICVSNAIQAIMQPAIQQRSKLVTVYSGVDTTRVFATKNRLRTEFDVPPGTLLIGNVAALAPHKDYFTFLDTVKALEGKLDARYFIIGEGALRPQITAAIERLGLQKVVYLTGFRKDIETVLPELDAMLVTSETEGLGTSVIDAFLAGVPVVATAAGGIPELIDDGQTGLLASVKDANRLATQLQRLFSNDALRSKLITSARIKAETFSMQHMAKQTLEIYREVLL